MVVIVIVVIVGMGMLMVMRMIGEIHFPFDFWERHQGKRLSWWCIDSGRRSRAEKVDMGM